MSNDRPSDEQLWSWVDRDAAELDEHLRNHPEDRARIEELRAAIGRIETADTESGLPSKIGKYRVSGLLGRGGMGVVYDAEEDHPRRRVALKVLPPEFAAEQRRLDLFRREADALARLSHPGIAVVYEIGTSTDQRPYLAMERIEGRPLDRFLSEGKAGRREKLRLAHKVCAAVGHAHDHGVVHRDVKPHNVLIRPDDEPVVVDFGLARILEDGPTQFSRTGAEGSLVGTLPYMSPEQVSGKAKIGPASDVYSLGVLLCEMVSGKRPHNLDGLSLIQAATVIERSPPKIRGIRGDLRTILRKALEKDPRRRYSSAGELAADLQRCMDGRPIEAAPPGTLRSAAMFVRRHWIATAGVVLAAAMLVSLLFPVRLPLPFLGDWFEGAPFEQVRWVGDTPQVRLGETWYGLVAIEDLKAAYIVGFCQQNTEDAWRRRFSEDLVQVIHRLGEWHVIAVDLHLRDLNDGRVLTFENVPLKSQWRRDIWGDRHSWPWTDPHWSETALHGQIDGRNVEILKVDDLLVHEALSGSRGMDLYDVYCDHVGHSPGPRVRLTIRDTDSGEVQTLHDVERVPTSGG